MQVPCANDLGLKDTVELIVVDVIQQMVVRRASAVNNTPDRRFRLPFMPCHHFRERVVMGDVHVLDPYAGPPCFQCLNGTNHPSLPFRKPRVPPLLAVGQRRPPKQQKMPCTTIHEPHRARQSKSSQPAGDRICAVGTHGRLIHGIQCLIPRHQAGDMTITRPPGRLIVGGFTQTFIHDATCILGIRCRFIKIDHPTPVGCLLGMSEHTSQSPEGTTRRPQYRISPDLLRGTRHQPEPSVSVGRPMRILTDQCLHAVQGTGNQLAQTFNTTFHGVRGRKIHDPPQRLNPDIRDLLVQSRSGHAIFVMNHEFRRMSLQGEPLDQGLGQPGHWTTEQPCPRRGIRRIFLRPVIRQRLPAPFDLI